MYKVSEDDGLTWSGPKELPSNILGPIKDKPIEVGGKIFSPSSTESEDGLSWNSHLEITDDDGEIWRKVFIENSSEYKTIQPTVLDLKGQLKVLLRSDQDVVMESLSNDKGKTWSPVEKTTIPNPNSGIDAVTLKNGKHLLVYNPLVSGENWQNGRNKLFLALSEDGVNWKEILKLEDKSEGEFSYPAIIQDEEGIIHISYTFNRERIKYLKLKLNLKDR